MQHCLLRAEVVNLPIFFGTTVGVNTLISVVRWTTDLNEGVVEVELPNSGMRFQSCAIGNGIRGDGFRLRGRVRGEAVSWEEPGVRSERENMHVKRNRVYCKGSIECVWHDSKF